MQFPFEICIKVCLEIPPSRIDNLFALGKTNKMYRRVCNSDLFWKKYYRLYVDPTYILESTKKETKRETKKETKSWKLRFFREYTQIKTLDCTQCTSDSIWNISQYNTGGTSYYNYITIDRLENGSVIGMPAIPVRFLSKDFSDEIRAGTTEKSIFLNKVKLRSTDTQSIIVAYPVENSMGVEGKAMKELEMVTYPFHHRAVVNFKSGQYRENVLDASKDLYEYDEMKETPEYKEFEYSKRFKSIQGIITNPSIISTETGVWRFKFPFPDVSGPHPINMSSLGISIYLK